MVPHRPLHGDRRYAAALCRAPLLLVDCPAPIPLGKDLLLTDLAIAVLALSEGKETDFEIFGQAALQISLGMDFEPAGGLHDRGIDGFFRVVAGRPDRYVQISKQQDYKTKISKTLKALEKNGRKVAALTYVTPLRIADKDIVEADFERDTNVAIRIRDLSWLTLQLQRFPELEAVFLDRYASTSCCAENCDRARPETVCGH